MDTKYRKACTILSAWQIANKGKKMELFTRIGNIFALINKRKEPAKVRKENKMKTIIVACGGGIATSATCATKINMALEERGLSNLAKAEAVDIKSLDNFIKTADVYVSITPMRGVVQN